jgi:CubicO group peptidase (beta-lactamase class C family)
MSPDIHGHCDPRFDRVRRTFAALFERGEEVGAAVSVYLGDDLVAELWAGDADRRSGRPWERDTPCLTFSCAKAVTAVCALRLCSEGAADPDGLVSAWWPEFAVAGKDRTTTAHLLSHQAGLPAFDTPVTVAESADPAALAARLAAQSPQWQPGTAHGYHALTFGWLAGELVRRLSGRTVGQYLAEYIAGPHGLDLWLGGPDEVIARTARMSRGAQRAADTSAPPPPPAPAPAPAPLLSRAPVPSPGPAPARAPAGTAAGPGDWLAQGAASPVPDLTTRAFSYPDPTSVPGGSNSPEVLRAGWPASGLMATASGLAGFYRDLLAGRLLDGAALRSALVPRATGPDRILGIGSSFGLGFMRPSEAFWVPPGGRESAFGHTGLSGAVGLGDPSRRLAIGYVTNRMGAELSAARGARLISAAYLSTG